VQIKLLLMDVDGTMTDGGATLCLQTDGIALETKTLGEYGGRTLPSRRLPACCVPTASSVAKVQHSSAAPTK
jgi:hypothetical protein